MISASQALRMCIFINILGILSIVNGRLDLGAVILFAGLTKFQLYVILKQLEDKDNDKR